MFCEFFKDIWPILDLTADGLHFDDLEKPASLASGLDKGRFVVLEVLGLSFSSMVYFDFFFELRSVIGVRGEWPRPEMCGEGFVSGLGCKFKGAWGLGWWWKAGWVWME